MFYFLSPAYLIIMAPCLLLALWAQMKVKTAYTTYSRTGNRRRITGAQAAREILDRNGLYHVKIEMARGFLSDHYDPRTETLRLSAQNYQYDSIAAVGIAAHEAGHAVQHGTHYAPLALRSAMVPITMFGSNFAMIFLGVGMFLGWLGMAKFGLFLFAFAVAFSVITLPVEFNASSRAKAMLVNYGIVYPDEMTGVHKVLNAAALTYVAAAITALVQLLYFAMRLGLLGGRDD